MNDTIYLDYNSTTPLAGAVRQAIIPFYDELFMLPGNVNWRSRAVEEAIEDARNRFASAVHSFPSEIVFTRDVVESINLAILGANKSSIGTRASAVPHVIVSTMECEAVRDCVQRLVRRGWEVTRLTCDRFGRVNPEQLERFIRPETRLISIQLANGDIGTVQDIEKLSKVQRGDRCLFHCDATQGLGKVGIDLSELQIDLMTFSGHHAYAPKGVGILYVRSGILLKPSMFGGWQENGLVPGIQNVAAIVGVGAAMELVQNAGMELGERMDSLTRRLYFRLVEELAFDIPLHGPPLGRLELKADDDENQSHKSGAAIRPAADDEENSNEHSELPTRLPNSLSLVLKGCDAEELLRGLPQLFASIGDGYSDKSPSQFPRTALEAIRVGAEAKQSTLRLSLGWNTTQEEVDRAVDVIAERYRNIKK